MDALSSGRKRIKLAILKDPHAGAFAIISGCAPVFTAYFGFASQGKPRRFCQYFALVVSIQVFGALSLMHLRMRIKEALQPSVPVHRRAVTGVLSYCGGSLSGDDFLSNPAAGLCGIVFSLGVVGFYYFKGGYKYFGGITGDLAGYFLCLL